MKVDKEGINDKVLAKQLAIQRRAVSKVAEVCKGQEPFAAEKVPARKVMEIINGLSMEDMNTLVKEFGVEAVNKKIYEAKRYERLYASRSK